MKTIILMIVSVMLASMVYADGQINIAYSPYTINQPGSYIVVCNITAGSTNPTITINTSDVTIDLNGHTLYGVQHNIDGIYSAVGNNNITVTNGVVRDWGYSGIALYGNNVQVSKVKSYNNGYQGFYLVGTSMRVMDCIADSNTQNGIEIGNAGIITGCIATNNGFEGIKVDGNSCQIIQNNANNNGDFVFLMYDGINVKGNNCQIIENNASGNALAGIHVWGSGGCLINNNNTSNNLDSGIYTNGNNQIIENTCSSNPGGIVPFSGDYVARNLCESNAVGIFCRSNGIYLEQNKLHGNTTAETLSGSSTGTGVLADVIW